MAMKKLPMLCIAAAIFNATIAQAHYAYVISPIVELTGNSWRLIAEKAPFLPAENYAVAIRDRLKDNAELCPRLHQALCHERVVIIQEKDDEFQIEVPTVFYQTRANGLRHHSFWAHKKHFITDTELKELNLDEEKFPPSLSFENPSVGMPCITLAMPHYAHETRIHYSAGTRFIPEKRQSLADKTMVYAFNAPQKTFTIIGIPNSLIAETAGSARKQFVTLLMLWAHLPNNHHIKYVWGGCSFTQPCDGSFILNTYPSSSSIHYYEHSQKAHENPKNGFDCSGLIVRAAQIAGIPLYCKNTATMLFNGAHVPRYESLQEGDIIWYPGHVMIVASLKNNTLIEAASYQSGFGIIHEIALNKVFKGIETYQELMAHAQEKKPIERLAKDGSVQKMIKRIALLQLPTA